MNYSLTTVTDSTAEPLTVAELKLQCRITHSEEDDYLSALIRKARVYYEKINNRSLLTKTMRLAMDAFPSWEIRLPRPPVQSISSVTYLKSEDGSSTTVASSDYQLDSYSEPARLAPAYSRTWPGTRAQLNAVTIQFVAGSTSTTSIPETAQHAIALMAAHWYENREPIVTGTIVNKLPFAIESLMAADDPGQYS